MNAPEVLQDLDLLPRPARHLVDMEAYFKIGHFHSSKPRSKRVLSVMCSRGCPEKCTFCTTPEVYGQLTRWRSTEHIMDEIENDDIVKIAECIGGELVREQEFKMDKEGPMGLMSFIGEALKSASPDGEEWWK